MEGIFRERSRIIYCPKPRPEVNGVFEFGPRKGEPYQLPAKKYTGWQNMDFCSLCPFFEEYHLDNEGVFCTYPTKEQKRQQKRHDKYATHMDGKKEAGQR